MILSEFIEATSKLENYYEKEYSNEQRIIMFDELKNFSIERYKKIISQCIRDCKFLPKIADIIKANGEIVEIKSEDNTPKYDCNKCNKTGYVMYTKVIQEGDKTIPYNYALRCTCKNGEYSNKKIPTYEEMGIEISDSLIQVSQSIDISKIKKILKGRFGVDKFEY